ncbi:MAG: sigma 54-interacting transcriptional regulator [Desulfobacteraceae bacterium]|jgi:transcriptional regulator of aroF, aroG, tyrA and aromatic amino acid transport
MNQKLELVFKDRVGIVADISALMAEYGINILSMEVDKRADKAHVYLEAEEGKTVIGKERLVAILNDVSDLLQLQFIDILPQKERENRVRVVLDNISDGVISIDKDGCITTMNKVAREALGCQEQEVVGQNIKGVELPDYNILECLEGRKFSHIKKNIMKERYQYFATGRPIIDGDGNIIGAVEIAKDMQEIKKLVRSISEPDKICFSDIIGDHPVILAAIAFSRRIATTDSIICIRGGSGTGKELFARAIHTDSERKGPFVPLNCAALPEQLLESELFGYVGGAFTGGRKQGRQGLFEHAAGGTVFLDEIGEMPLGSQAKILRVIQDKRVRRIGGSKEIPVNTRIITATHRNLEQLVDEKLFRQDLYYRINVLPIHIPPLSQRGQDIPLLADHFLFQLASKLDKPIPTISNQAMDKLRRHHWPGNVRELKNVMERAAILSEKSVIEAASILFSFELGKGEPISANCVPGKAIERCKLKEVMADYEKGVIGRVMKKCRSKRQAARRLDISHTALMNKLKKYKL